MSSTRAGHLAGALLVAVATVTGSSAGADSLRRRCIHSCGAQLAPCVVLARSRGTTVRRTCTGDRKAKVTCRRTARAVVRSGTRACRALRKDCRACCQAGGQGAKCPVGRPLAFDPPPPLDLSAVGLPAAVDGHPLLLTIPGAQLEVDPSKRDPIVAAGACARWITSCVVDGAHALDDCTRSAPPCGTERPWEEPATCCPASCFARYQDARRAGTDALAAFETVVFGADPCMPGVADLLRTGRQ